MGAVMNVFFSICVYQLLGGTISVPHDIGWSALIQFVVSGELLIAIFTYSVCYSIYWLIPITFIYVINPITAQLLEWVLRLLQWVNLPSLGIYDTRKPNSLNVFLYQMSLIYRSDLPLSIYKTYMRSYYHAAVILFQFLIAYNGLISGEYIFTSTLDITIIYALSSVLIYLTVNGAVARLWTMKSPYFKKAVTYDEPDSDKRDIPN